MTSQRLGHERVLIFMDTLFKSIFARKTYFEVFKYKEMGITRA